MARATPRRIARTSPRTRYAETVAAGEVLGLASVRILSIHDGELENTDDVREAVTRRIREVRAETLLSGRSDA